MTITIYLTKETKLKLLEIQKEYRISLSTLAQMLTDYFKPNFIKYGNDLFNEYIAKDHRDKTTIKPNNLDRDSDMYKKCNNSLPCVSHVYSNILHLYANKELKYLYQETNTKLLQKYENQLKKEFYKKKEIYWDYNNGLRNQIRIVKKNPNYFKQIIGTN